VKDKVKMNIKVIGFDADDTLWVNEPHYQETVKYFCSLLSDYLDAEQVSAELLKTEKQNIELYGFGAKGFMLSLIETALRVSKNKIDNETINKIIALGKELLDKPIELLNGVENVLAELNKKYKLIVATKGDLLDQERKLKKSGLAKYFHHVEIMSDKKVKNYKMLLQHLEVSPESFLMIGNSFKSDILPVLELGGYGIYIPYHITWQHELVDDKIIGAMEKVKQIKKIEEVLKLV
jgi:putative hydrolase of the HAD superfamily